MSQGNIKSLLGIVLRIAFWTLILCIPLGLIFGFGETFMSGFDFKSIETIISLPIYHIGALIVIKSLLDLTNTSETSPFVIENVIRLKRMGYIFFIYFIINYVFHGIMNADGGVLSLGPVFTITVEMVLFGIFTLLCFVLADMFDKAIKIKEDNDLTI